MAMPLNTGYLFWFPYPTPPSIKMQFQIGVWGDYVLFAFPYPNDLSFSVSCWSHYPGPAASFAALNNNNCWIYDPVAQLLYVKYYLWTGTAPYDYPVGFFDYSEPTQWLFVNTNCSLANCAVKGTTHVPPVYDDGSVKYEVILCDPSVGYVGKGYFTFNNATGELYYNVYHVVQNPVAIMLGSLTAGTPFSPSRGSTTGIVGGFAGAVVTVNGATKASGITTKVTSFGYNSNTISLCPLPKTTSVISSGKSSGTIYHQTGSVQVSPSSISHPASISSTIIMVLGMMLWTLA
jgi:hypothetical protein